MTPRTYRETPEYHAFRDLLGKRVQQSRESRGLTQCALARCLNIHQASLVSLERGHYMTDIYRVRQVALALHASLDMWCDIARPSHQDEILRLGAVRTVIHCLAQMTPGEQALAAVVMQAMVDRPAYLQMLARS